MEVRHGAYLVVCLAVRLTNRCSTSGFIYDASGSYSWAFYFGGIVILMAAATMSFMPCVLRYDARRGLYHFRPRTVTPNNRDEQIGQVEVGRNNELIGERETPNSEL